MITEELKDKLNIEFRMDISHMFLGYENNMPLDEFNRMLDILVNKATKILITDRASEVGAQPEVMPTNGGQWQNEFLHNIAFIRQHLNKQEKGFFTLCDTINYLNNTYIKSEDPTFEEYYNACGEYLINNSVEW